MEAPPRSVAFFAGLARPGGGGISSPPGGGRAAPATPARGLRKGRNAAGFLAPKDMTHYLGVARVKFPDTSQPRTTAWHSFRRDRAADSRARTAIDWPQSPAVSAEASKGLATRPWLGRFALRIQQVDATD